MKPTAIVLSLWLALTAWAICLNTPIVVPPPEPVIPTNAPSVGASLTLPIEVLGAPGTVESFALPLVSGASTVTGLKLKVYNLSYDGKMGVRINGGAWRNLSNENVIFPAKEIATFGMGGIHDTLRLTVPLIPGEIVDGTNNLDFKFNDLDGKTIGYRILSLNLVAGTNELISPSAFTWDDPALWVPPSTNSADINAGKDAWYNLEISEAGRVLEARCTDCHAQDGYDLKFFNFSARSIIQRSIFHGVPPATATNIASYILSLPVPYVAEATPWNPPFQPGPGIDAKPVAKWAAGAGLEAVLENDVDMIPFIFPLGAYAGVLDAPGAIINAREIPLTVQLPSWNRWLPKVHPLDQYPTYATNVYLTRYAIITNYLRTVTNALTAATYIKNQSSPWDQDSGKTGIVKPASVTDPAYKLWAENERDKRHWRAVKVWELMQAWGAADYGHEIYGSTNSGGSPLNDRRWFHGEVFRLGPHVIGLVKDGKTKEDDFHAESMQWYQLQLVLNDGNRDNASIVPIDWGYQHALNVSAWDNPTNMTFYGNVVLNVVKGLEVAANGLSVTNAAGWNLFKPDVYRLAPGDTLRGKYFSLPTPMRKAVSEAVLVAWLGQCERFTRAEYAARKNFKFDAALKDLIYNMALNFDEIGVDPVILNRLVDFGVLLFPTDDWSGARP